jgi:hypothetical protein
MDRFSRRAASSLLKTKAAGDGRVLGGADGCFDGVLGEVVVDEKAVADAALLQQDSTTETRDSIFHSAQSSSDGSKSCLRRVKSTIGASVLSGTVCA